LNKVRPELQHADMLTDYEPLVFREFVRGAGTGIECFDQGQYQRLYTNRILVSYPQSYHQSLTGSANDKMPKEHFNCLLFRCRIIAKSNSNSRLCFFGKVNRRISPRVYIKPPADRNQASGYQACPDSRKILGARMAQAKEQRAAPSILMGGYCANIRH